MKYRLHLRPHRGFTIVELLIVIAVIAILAAITTASYSGVRQRAARSVVSSTLRNAFNDLEVITLDKTSPPDKLPDNIQVPVDVTIRYQAKTRAVYSGLSDVQNGVLFHEICQELVADERYTVIHSSDGAQTAKAMLSCSDNIRGNRLQITSWNTQTWQTPITKEQLESYIASVPYDSWWIDRQEVTRSFYRTLISRYTFSGGTWPILSFWDHPANDWTVIHKEELPDPDSGGEGEYCLEAYHEITPDEKYIVTRDNSRPRLGECELFTPYGI